MLGLGLEGHGLGTATAAAPDTPTSKDDQPPPPAKKFCSLFAQRTRSAIVICTHRISQSATAADKVVGFHQQRRIRSRSAYTGKTINREGLRDTAVTLSAHVLHYFNSRRMHLFYKRPHHHHHHHHLFAHQWRNRTY